MKKQNIPIGILLLALNLVLPSISFSSGTEKGGSTTSTEDKQSEKRDEQREDRREERREKMKKKKKGQCCSAEQSQSAGSGTEKQGSGSEKDTTDEKE
ncbi:MAG: hypothetical protein AB7G93_00705 [Bdellovibrionales bacterium]